MSTEIIAAIVVAACAVVTVLGATMTWLLARSKDSGMDWASVTKDIAVLQAQVTMLSVASGAVKLDIANLQIQVNSMDRVLAEMVSTQKQLINQFGQLENLILGLIGKGPQFLEDEGNRPKKD